MEKRDAFVRKLLAKSRVRFVEIAAARNYDVQAIRNRVLN